MQVLDVVSTVSPAYHELKEIALFLTTPNSLPPDMALGLYVSIGAAKVPYMGVMSKRSQEGTGLLVHVCWPCCPRDEYCCGKYCMSGLGDAFAGAV